MKRGEIRWYAFRLPDKRRPVLILTRDEMSEVNAGTRHNETRAMGRLVKEGTILKSAGPSDDVGRVIPVPIPNTEVKPVGADGTARVTAWESRKLPGLIKKPA